MTKTINCWQVGTVNITRVIESETGGFPPCLRWRFTPAQKDEGKYSHGA